MTYARVILYLRGLTGGYDANLPTMGNIVGPLNRIGVDYAAETHLPLKAFVGGRCPLHHAFSGDQASP